MMNIHRFLALTRKEFYQMLRDPSSFLIGIVIPLMLIVLMGSGLSLDVKNLPVAVALEDTSPTARDALSFLNGSPYFSPSYVTSSKEAIALMDARQADAVLVIPPDFTSRLEQGHATVQILLYGIDATTANAANQYITSGLQSWQSQWVAAHRKSARTGTVIVVPRQWFNDANTSSWMFLPGLIVIVMTLVGVFLTALVMAREWERGTLEAIFATPVRPLEIIAAKTIPYFCIAMVGLGLCLMASYYGYGVPIHGSLLLVFLSSVEYVFIAIGMGLTISSLVKNDSGLPDCPRCQPAAHHYAERFPLRLAQRPHCNFPHRTYPAGYVLHGTTENAVSGRHDGTHRHQRLPDSSGICPAVLLPVMETDLQGGIVMSSLSLTLYHIYALIIKELLATLKDPKSRVILIVPVLVQDCSSVIRPRIIWNMSPMPLSMKTTATNRQNSCPTWMEREFLSGSPPYHRHSRFPRS